MTSDEGPAPGGRALGDARGCADGVPTLEAVERLCRSEGYQEILRYSDQFQSQASRVLKRYRWSLGRNPLRGWSRRWEYSFAWQRLREFAAAAPALRRAQGRLRILDAGSGVTFFPYFVAERLPGARVACCDYEASYGAKFEAINGLVGQDRVAFTAAPLQGLPFPATAFDALYCISVLEHTGDYGRVLDEFRRVVRPGGLVVITFDISLDGRCDVRRDQAAALLSLICEKFALDPGPRLAELERLERPGEILTTDHARATAPELLPWPYPRLKSLYDLLHGRGWTGGFFSLTCYCLAARVPPARK